MPTMTTPDVVCETAASATTSMSFDAATQVSTVLKALAEPLRLRMLSLITTSPTGEACVCDIATVADVAQPTVSHHLKVLKDVGVLTSQRRGTWVYYRVAPALRGAVSTLLDAFAPATLDATPTLDRTVGLSDVDAVLARIATDLGARFVGLDARTVTATVRESYTALARSAGVRAHLIVSTERFARQRLEDQARVAGANTAVANAAVADTAAASLDGADGPKVTPAARTPQVLFVCVANAGRSQLAAELVRHYAGDRIIVRSAGSAPAGDIHASVRGVLTGLGADDDNLFPKPLTDDAVRAADVVVTMGCGDTCPIVPGTRYEDWVVGDPALASQEGVFAITAQIDTHVRTLLTSLLPGIEFPAIR